MRPPGAPGTVGFVYQDVVSEELEICAEAHQGRTPGWAGRYPRQNPGAGGPTRWTGIPEGVRGAGRLGSQDLTLRVWKLL